MNKRNLITKAELARQAGVTAAVITNNIKGVLKPAMEGKKINANHECVKEWLKRNEPKTDPLYSQAVEVCRATGNFSASNISRKCKIGYARAKRIFETMVEAGTDSSPPIETKIVPPPPPIETKIVPPPPPISPGVQHTTKTKKHHALKKLNEENESTLHEIPDDIMMFIDMTLRELIQRYGTDVAFLDWLKATKSIEDINEKRLKNAATKGELVSRDLIKIGVIDPINAAHVKLLTDGAKTIARRVTAMHGAGRSIEDCEKFVADQMTSFIRPVKSKVARALKNI